MQTEHTDLFLAGNIDDRMLQSLIQELQHERYQRHIPLRLFINSPGGSMPLALSISRLLLNLFTTIETYNMAMVDSAAVCLYLTGSKRHAFPGSRFFLHPPAIDLHEALNEVQLSEQLNLIRSDTEAMVEFYHERTALEHDALRPWFETATVLSAAEAINHGIATDLCRDIPDFSPHFLNNTKR